MTVKHVVWLSALKWRSIS